MDEWINGPRISKNNNYNILRIICAAAVIYGHMYVLIGTSVPTLFANAINAIGLKMLMVMSGYMITQSCIYEKKLRNYLLKRTFRLFPALIVCVLITIFIIGPLLTTVTIKEYFSNPVTWQYLYNIVLKPSFCLPGVFESNPYAYAVNGSLWSLPVEALLYIVIYIVLRILCKFKYKKEYITLLTVLLCILQCFHVVVFPNFSYVIWGIDFAQALMVCPFFFIGSLYAVTDIKKYCNIQIAVLLLLFSTVFHSNIYVIYEILAMIAIPYFVISFGECNPPYFASCFQKADISYGIYLWGFIVQQTLVYIFGVKGHCSLNPNYLFILSFTICVVLALFLWLCVEKPASKILKKLAHHQLV